MLLLVFTAGCQSLPKRTAAGISGADPVLLLALQQRPNWSARASLGIWTEKNGDTPEQNITASLEWSERAEQLNVVLRGPLGVGEMILSDSPTGATLRRGSVNMAGEDPSVLVQQALNLVVPVPLGELSSWMRGLPGSATNLTYDNAGRLQTLGYVDKSGIRWRANVLRYIQADNMDVPGLITAKGGPYNVRLVLKDWRFDPINSDTKPAASDSAGRLSIPGRSS